MKGFKKIASLLTVAALMALLPGANALKASAATPTTHYVKYNTDKHEWRVQVGEWKDGYDGRETYYLNNGDEAVKDGDILVVLDNEEHETGNKELTINAHLSNLTVNRAHVVIFTGGVDECYVLGDSYAAINGDITNGYVYDDAACTFNNNVTNLHLIADKRNEVRMDVTVGGTVAYASTANKGGIINEYYNFTAGSFVYDDKSGLMTDSSKYSTTGSAPAAAPAETAPTQETAQPQNNTAADSGEYDDVPKTGESNVLFMILLAISAVSFAGCMALNLRPVLKKVK